MIIALLLLAGLGWWLHREGVLLPNLRRLGVSAGGGLIALRLIETGQVLAGALVAAGTTAWWHWTRRRPTSRVDVDAARAILGVAPTADATEVHAAWRRAMAAAHPDAGGSAEHSRSVTSARDMLLQRTPRMRRD